MKILGIILFLSITQALDIETPINDKNAYDYIELDNGLKCLVVSCLDCPQAAASLSINVGSNQDTIPGLAHFVEHMLFFSSKSYPEEDYLRSFLNNHSGYTNAYTDKQETNFFFTVSNDALEESLKIFSKAFIEPVFLESAVNREVKAVNSEHDKNRFSDGWRMYRLIESLAGEKHPISHFATGNTETLNVEGLVGIVQKFYDDYYTAGNMKLVIYGKYPIDILLKYAVDYYSDIPIGYSEFLYDPPFLNSAKIILAPKINNGSSLVLFWAVPSEYRFYRSQPSHFLSYLLNYSGKNSISASLSELIGHMESYISMTYPDFSLIQIEITLTDKGFEKWKYVTESVLAYIENLKQLTSDELELLWNDYSAIARANYNYFKFSTPGELVSAISSNMQNFPERHYIAGFEIKRAFNNEIFTDILNMITSEKMFAVFMSDAFDKGANFDSKILEFTSYDPYYNFYYDILKLNLAPNGNDFAIVSVNGFIPTDFNVLTCETCKNEVIELISSPQLNIWYKFDQYFEQPKVIISVMIFTNSNSMLSDIHAELVSRIILEELNMFITAGFYADIKSEYSGISITLAGWRDKMENFLEEIIKINTNPSLNKLNSVLEFLNEKYVSAINSQPYQIAYEKLGNIILQDYYTNSERLSLLNTFTQKDYTDFLNIFKNTNIDFFVYGNVLQSNVNLYQKIIQKYIKSSEKNIRKYPKATSVSQAGISTDTSISNHCIFNWYDFGYFDLPTTAALRVLVAKSSDEAFKVLRSNYQLGYIVFSDVIERFGTNSMYLIVQGSYKSPPEMNEIIDVFWDNFEFLAEDMSLASRVAESLLWKYESMDAEHGDLWLEIMTGRKQFSYYRDLAEEIKKVKLEDVQKLLEIIREENEDISIQIFMDKISETDMTITYNKKDKN